METAKLTPSNTEIATSKLIEGYQRHPLATLETYKYFNQNSEASKLSHSEFVECVMNGVAAEAPLFEYDSIDIDSLLDHRDSLTALLQDIPNDRELTPEERIVRENISNRLDEVGIMMLTLLQSGADPESEEYNLLSYQLKVNMQEVYGKPEVEHFRGILGYRLKELAGVEKLDRTTSEVMEAWSYIKAALPSDLPAKQPYQMSHEARDWYKQELEMRLEPSRRAVQNAIDSGLVELDSDGLLDINNIVIASDIALQARGFNDWRAAPTDATQIDTTQTDKTIYIPKKRTMSLDAFDRVVQAHEIDQHVARRENGDQSGVGVLSGSGAHGYLAWEEGNGVVNEGLLLGRVNNTASAFGYFLSGGLAIGQDGESSGRNFRETCEIVWRLNFIADFITNKHNGAEADKRTYIDKATAHLKRIFRGTDGKTPGTVFTKDTVTYYLGGVEVMEKWDEDMMLSEVKRRQAHRLERSAKINPIRPDHQLVAEAAIRDNQYAIR